MRSCWSRHRTLSLLWLMALLVAAPLLIAADDEKPTKPEDDDKPRERPAAEEAADIVIHEWNFWIADPTTEKINAADLYPTNLPAQVETIRSRKMPQGIVLPSPLSMMTFTGKPVSDIEIDLRIPGGRVLSHWPPGKYKNNRLRWLDFSLAENLEGPPQPVPTPADHWFNEARKEGLYLKSKARADRFLAYDVELNFNTNLKVAGGPDTYQVTNPGPQPLADVLISAPTPEGRRIGWLDELPVTKGAAAPAATPAPAPAPGTTPAATGAPTNAVPAPAAANPPAPRAAVRVELKAAEAEAKAAAAKDEAVKAEAIKAEAIKAEAIKAEAVKAEAVKKEAVEQQAAKEAGKEKPAVTKEETARKAAEAEKEAAEAKTTPTPPTVGPAPIEPPKADKPADAKPGDTKPSAVKPADAKPAEAKPAEVKPAEAKPEPGVDVAMSEPLKADTAEYKSQTVDSLRARLVKSGLTENEAALLLSIYTKAIFESEDLVVIYRVPQSVIDEKLPLAVYPDAKKIVRVGLVLVRNLDPKISSDIQQLVAQLGDNKYTIREAAAKRLSTLGPLAAPALKEAAKSSDAEVQFRAERILQEQEPDETGQQRRVRAARIFRAG